MEFARVNYLIDKIMPALKDPAAFAVVSLVARNTWGKKDVEWVELSFSDIKNATGMNSPNTIKRAIEKAGKFIEQRPKENQGYEYRMRTISNSDAVKDETMSNSAISENDTPSEFDTVLYQNLTPSMSENDTVLGDSPYNKEKEKEDKEVSPPSPPTPEKPKRKSPSEPNPFPFKPLKQKSKQESPAEKRKQAIIVTCGLDDTIPTHVREAENATAQLSKYTAEYIQERYSPGGWWYLHDWRGKQGQQPTIKAIVETIAKKTHAAVNSNGYHKQPAPAPSQGLVEITPGSGRY